jgi:DNA polymerase III alpha subunit (gram-positive type)
MNHTQPHLSDFTFLALDTETTGISPLVYRLVETGRRVLTVKQS